MLAGITTAQFGPLPAVLLGGIVPQAVVRMRLFPMPAQRDVLH